MIALVPVKTLPDSGNEEKQKRCAGWRMRDVVTRKPLNYIIFMSEDDVLLKAVGAMRSSNSTANPSRIWRTTVAARDPADNRPRIFRPGGRASPAQNTRSDQSARRRHDGYSDGIPGRDEEGRVVWAMRGVKRSADSTCKEASGRSGQTRPRRSSVA